MDRPRASRPAPPTVPPVTHDGVRYEQITNGIDAGLPTLTGNLAAVGPDGKRLWTLQVYARAIDPAREADVQWVYFKTMAFDPDGRLRITNERNDSFLVDVTARTVTPAG